MSPRGKRTLPSGSCVQTFLPLPPLTKKVWVITKGGEGYECLPEGSVPSGYSIVISFYTLTLHSPFLSPIKQGNDLSLTPDEAKSFFTVRPRKKRGLYEECYSEGCDFEEVYEVYSIRSSAVSKIMQYMQRTSAQRRVKPTVQSHYLKYQLRWSKVQLPCVKQKSYIHQENTASNELRRSKLFNALAPRAPENV